jgi:hypothetical protein
MTRHVLVACALLAWSVPAAAQTQTRRAAVRPPSVPRVEVGVGAGMAGGVSLGDRDASLRSNSLASTPFRLFTSDTRMDPAPFLEVRLGYRLVPRLTVEGALGVARPDLAASLSADIENAPSVDATSPVTEYVITGGALWRFSTNPRRRLTPFASGGAGVVRHVHDGNALIESGVNGYAGGGLLYALGRRAGLRLDGRVHFLNGGIADGHGVLARGAVSGSIFVAF